MSTLKAGDRVPDAVFKTIIDGELKDVSGETLFTGRKVLIVGVVGAFTPVCTKRHLPEFLPYQQKLKDAGLTDEIACVSVADPFVLQAWRESLGFTNEITMLTDTNAAFATAMGLALDLSGLGLGLRSARYLLYVQDNVISILNVEQKPSELDLTSAETAFKLLVGL